jgi:hypothetical protein
MALSPMTTCCRTPGCHDFRCFLIAVAMSCLSRLRGLLQVPCLLAAVLIASGCAEGTTAPATASSGVLPPPIAVIGDSDSHSYQDALFFPASSGLRGGVYHKDTLQWIEVLARLRGKQLDPGDWAIHGSHPLIARAHELAGGRARAPRKQDYRYNFAVSGADCDSLMAGELRQVPRLVGLMDQAAGRWRDGVVVIRIGVNAFGGEGQLQQLAQDPASPMVVARIDHCLAAIRAAVGLIREHHPHTGVVLVGIFNNAHWARLLDRWQSPLQLAHIERGLDRFDHALEAMAAADPKTAFFNDRAWFASHWGGRDQAGRPAYRIVEVGKLRVGNSIGDSPDHANVGDGHAGLVWNALWAQALVGTLNADLDMRLAPLEEEELERLLPAGEGVAGASPLD